MQDKSYKILIVEDEAIIGMALSADLEDAGHQVIDVSPTGEEALTIMKQHKVELVILDINLGNNMDGLQTLEAIRKISNPYIFIVSGNSDAPTAQRVKAMGVDYFFVKPVNTQHLLEAIQKLDEPSA